MSPFPDPRFMRQALSLGEKGRGRTCPNPPVGAVLVKGGAVVGRGWHRGAGLPHAEVEAIRDAGERAGGADLYVTLEPCDHTGRTGPCTEAILAAGIRRVAVSAGDPDPRVSGKGFRRLREAGLRVEEGVLGASGEALIREWAHRLRTGRPYVTVKLAMSLDGRIAAAGGDSRWVTGEAARRAVHGVRAKSDAVLVGGGTLRADDPLLTVRTGAKGEPRRVVVTTDPARLARSRMAREGGGGTVYAASPASLLPPGVRKALAAAGVVPLPLPSRRGVVDAGALLDRLGAEGIGSLLVEGGGRTAGWLAKEGAVDRYLFFVAPKLLGGGVPALSGFAATAMAGAIPLRLGRVRRIGEDLLVEAFPTGGE